MLLILTFMKTVQTMLIFLDIFRHTNILKIQDEIRKDFTFSDHIVESCEGIIDNPECVSVHIRRGDYVNLQDHHPLQTVDYYEKVF